MKCLHLLFIPALLAVATGELHASAPPTSPPNVLFIAVDDLNAFPTFMGVYPDAITPHLDRLAASGIAFTNAHSQYPLCGPSRASILSGFLPSTLGFTDHMSDEAVDKQTRALGSKLLHTTFSENGYETLAVGKIYHNHVPKGSVDQSGGRGSFYSGTGKLKKNWPQDGTGTDWAQAPNQDEKMSDYAAAKWAIQQLNATHEKPFLLMVGFLRPHVPWYVPKKWHDLYDPQKLTRPAYKKDDLNDVPAISREINISTVMPSTEWAIENQQWGKILQAYLACVSFTDHYVGEVIQALEQSEYKDNTIIVLFSDHGYHMGEKNTFQKQSLWEESSLSPLIFSGPGILPGQRSTRVVSLLDIYPTLLELCQLPANHKNEGHSLLPLIENPRLNWQHPAITSWKGNNFAVQDQQYRYIRYSDQTEELYDHTNDPNEWTNISEQTEYADIKNKLASVIPKVIHEAPVQ